MPVIDGFEATRRLKARVAVGDPLLHIVVITGSISSDDRMSAQQAGVDGFMNKPFEAVAMNAQIECFRAYRRTSTTSR